MKFDLLDDTCFILYKNVLGGLCQPAVRRVTVYPTKRRQGSG